MLFQEDWLHTGALGHVDADGYIYLTGLKKGTSFHLSDVKLPSGVKAVVKGRENPVVVSVVTSAAEASAEATAEAAAAAPAGKGGKAAPAAKAPAAKAPAAKK